VAPSRKGSTPAPKIVIFLDAHGRLPPPLKTIITNSFINHKSGPPFDGDRRAIVK
jgi:hypothetical protein